MEAGLKEIVRSLYRSWIYDTYFSLYRAIHPGGKNSGGEVQWGNIRIPNFRKERERLQTHLRVSQFNNNVSYRFAVLYCIVSSFNILSTNRNSYNRCKII